MDVHEKYLKFPGEVPVKWKILGRLLDSRGTFVSGEELGDLLQISRPAIWKQIQILMREGIPIEAAHRKGYRVPESLDLLRPDQIQASLVTSFLGRAILYTRETGSTNDDAKLLAGESSPDELPEGTVLIADTQSRGKGRLGRSWQSPPGGIFMSIILRPRVSPSRVPALSIVVGFAVASAIKDVLGLFAEVKWPNDVLIAGRKVAGVLCEMRAELDVTSVVVAGIGVNANFDLEVLPPLLRDKTTSLSWELGRPVDRNSLVASVLNTLEPLYMEFLGGGLSRLLPRVEKVLAYTGMPVRIQNTSPGSPEVSEGILEGIDPDGRLILGLPDGSRRYFSAGDLSLRPV